MVRLHPLQLPVSRIEGCFIKPLSYKASVKISTGLAAMSAATATLQQALVFTAARLQCTLCTGLSNGCTVDSVQVAVTMKNPYNPTDSIVFDKTLDNLTCISRYRTDIDVAPLLIRWPDSLAITLGLRLPPKTFFSFTNKNAANGASGSIFRFAPVLEWNAAVPLSFHIGESAWFEPARISVALTEEQLDLIGKLEYPAVRIILSIENRTDINCRIFILAAVKRYENELIVLPDSIIGSEHFTSRLSENLISLTTDNGITVMAHNAVNCSELTFDEHDITTFLSGEPCIIRIPIQLLPGTIDALRSGDFFRIRATGIIEGTGTTDTLASLN